jgi:hypothetical protein
MFETSVLAAARPSRFAGPRSHLVSWGDMQVREIHMSAIRGLSSRSSFRSIISRRWAECYLKDFTNIQAWSFGGEST